MKALFAALALACGLAVVADSGDAAVLTYRTSLSGPAEEPPNASPGSGSSTLVVDTVERTFTITADFADLLASTTVAHIHGPTLTPGAGTAGVMTGVPTFLGFPAGVTSGSYTATFGTDDLATYNPSFVFAQGGIDGAEAAFFASLAAGTAYLNIHSEMFPSGEIRGFFTPAPIPLPGGLVLALSGLGVFGALGLRRRRPLPA